MGNLLIITGAMILLAGLVLKGMEHFGIFKLPGDIVIQKGNFTFFFPVVTMIALSVVLTIIANLFFRKP